VCTLPRRPSQGTTARNARTRTHTMHGDADAAHCGPVVFLEGVASPVFPKMSTFTTRRTLADRRARYRRARYLVERRNVFVSSDKLDDGDISNNGSGDDGGYTVEGTHTGRDIRRRTPAHTYTRTHAQRCQRTRQCPLWRSKIKSVLGEEQALQSSPSHGPPANFTISLLNMVNSKGHQFALPKDGASSVL
jgi:hypothetical protein